MFQDPWAPRHDSQKVDLAFIVDCTGSMGSYIKQAQKHVRAIAETVARTAFNVTLALVEYRDHPPQDSSFITRAHDFTSSLTEMKSWVDAMRASGGGDAPESVACALEMASKLSYRKDATKICVLIADAPPHGLGIDPSDGFPNGCPTGSDPLVACRAMVENGIVLYCVGCEPPLSSYRDFFMGLAYMTGGQYVPLSRAQVLSKVIINGTLEEVAQEELMGFVFDFLHLAIAKKRQEKKVVTVDDLANDLCDHLSLTNNKCMQLHLNDQMLEPPSSIARKFPGLKNLSQACKLIKKEKPSPTDAEDKRFESFLNKTATMEVIITGPVEVNKSQSERLLMKGLGRTKQPVMHDEVTGETVVEKL